MIAMKATRRLTQAGVRERIEGHLYEDYKRSFDSLVEASRAWLLTNGKAILLSQKIPNVSNPPKTPGGPSNSTSIASLLKYRADKRRKCGENEAPYTPVLVVSYEPSSTPGNFTPQGIRQSIMRTGPIGATPLTATRRPQPLQQNQQQQQQQQQANGLQQQVNGGKKQGQKVLQVTQTFEAVAAASATPMRSKHQHQIQQQNALPSQTPKIESNNVAGLKPQLPIVQIAPLIHLPPPSTTTTTKSNGNTTNVVVNELHPLSPLRLELPEQLLRSPAPASKLPVNAPLRSACPALPSKSDHDSEEEDEESEESDSDSMSVASSSSSIALSVSTTSTSAFTAGTSQALERVCPMCNKSILIENYAAHVRELNCMPKKQPQQTQQLTTTTKQAAQQQAKQKTPEPLPPPPKPQPKMQTGMPVGALTAGYSNATTTANKQQTPTKMPPISASVLARPPLPPPTTAAAVLLQQQQANNSQPKRTSARLMPPPMMTPKKSPVIVAQANAAMNVDLSSSQRSYEIDPYHSSDSEDDEEEQKQEAMKKKKQQQIPSWAKGEALQRALTRQESVDPDKIFTCEMSCNLEEIFGSMAQTKKRKGYRVRGSSGNWQQDNATWREEIAYKQAMGFVAPAH